MKYNIQNNNDALLEEREQTIQKWINDGDFEVIVHNGEFHADEILACALLEHVIEGELKITRTRNTDIIGLMVDVGEGIFDHHGDSKIRNGNFAIVIDNDGKEVPIPHCGATLIATALEKCGYLKIGPALEKELVAVAAMDNGVKINLTPKSVFVHDFNTLWNENREDQDEQFKKALRLTSSVINRMITIDLSSDAELELLNKLPLDKEVVELPQAGLSWTKALARPESVAKFVIFLGDNNTWFIQCVPPTPERWTEMRIPLPESWTKRPRNSGEFIFCHIGRFIAGFTTREAAFRAAEEALNP